MEPTGTRAADASRALRVVLPGYSATYAANDYSDPERRRTDREIVEHLVGERLGSFGRGPRRLVLELRGVTPCERGERITEAAYRRLLERGGTRSLRRLRALAPRVALLVLLGFGLLYVANALDEARFDKTRWETWSEVIRVGGWISIWTGAASLFSSGLHSLNRYRVYRRLGRLPVEFVYAEEGAPTPSR